MTDFLFEGGYAAYIWPAYLITAAAILALTVWISGSYKRAKLDVERLEQSGERTS
jgi:heme exporter protein CcmD